MLSSEYVLHDCIMYFPLCHICPEFNCKYLVVVYLHSTESALTNLNCELLFKLIIIFFFSLLVTLDLKALYMLLIKVDDESFVLAGRGCDIEFCFLCHALRVLISFVTL